MYLCTRIPPQIVPVFSAQDAGQELEENVPLPQYFGIAVRREAKIIKHVTSRSET